VALVSKDSPDTKASQILQRAPLGKDSLEKAIATLPADVRIKLRPRVYFHVASKEQLAPTVEMQRKLIADAFVSPGIQNVEGRGFIPATMEVRYFDEKSKPMAEQILAKLRADGAKDGRVSLVNPSAKDLRISPEITSHFEVWMGQNSL
jgi:hypothetical protein